MTLPKYLFIGSIVSMSLGVVIGCYKNDDKNLPPCDTTPSACGGYPADGIVVTDTKREAGVR